MNTMTRTKGALPPARCRKGITVYGTVWIQCLDTSDTQEYMALVDTVTQCILMLIEGQNPEVTGGSQQLTVLEADMILTGNEWQKDSIVTDLEAPRILGIDYLKDTKGTVVLLVQLT